MGVERIRTLAGGEIDWTALQTMADVHSVTSLLYRGLRLACLDLIPGAIVRDLKDKVRDNAVRGLLLTNELLKVLNLLQENHIQAVPFKGPVLSALAYGDATLREFRDLDILVRRSDVQAARTVLMSHGFESEKKAAGFDEAPPAHYHYGLTHPENHISVELHWRTCPHYFVSLVNHRGLWDRLQPFRLMGTDVTCLAPQDSLTVLCEHGHRHCWNQLSLVCDLTWLITSQPQWDWSSIIESATGEGRQQRRAFIGLSLAHQLLAMPLPTRIRQNMNADRRLEPLVGSVKQGLFSAKRGGTDRASQCLFHLRAAEFLWDKMLYGLGLIYRICTPNTDDRAAVPLPRILYFFYYPVRLLRLTLAAGRWAIRQSRWRER